MADKSYAGNPAYQKDPLSDYRNQYDDIFRGSDYWDLYQALLTQYSQFPEGTFLGGLTGENKKNQYSHLQNLGTALAALAENKRSTDYNSISNQVQMEKAAGLNPDLTGVSGQGKTTEAQMPAPFTPIYDNPIPHLLSFASMIGNAVIGSQSMVSQSILNNSLRLDNLNKANDITLTGASLVDDSYDPETEIAPAVSVGYRTGSRKLDRDLEKRSSSWRDTIALKIKKKQNERELAKVRKEKFDIISSPGYSDDDKFYDDIASDLADLYLKVIELEQAESLSKSSYNKEYYDNKDGKTTADAENSSASFTNEYNNARSASDKANSENSSDRRTIDYNDQWKEIFTLEKGMLKKIRKNAKKGNTAAIRTIFRIFGDAPQPNDLSSYILGM